jgi:hypothetical protein
METEIEQETEKPEQLSQTTQALRNKNTKLFCFTEGSLKRVVEVSGNVARLSCGHVRELATKSRLLALAT